MASSDGQQVKFARRSPSGRYISVSREEIDLSPDELSEDFVDCTLSIPSSPDKQPNGGGTCGMPGCHGKLIKDERGNVISPCECRFQMCRDCYMDAQKNRGICPGCKQSYKVEGYNDVGSNYETSFGGGDDGDGDGDKERLWENNDEPWKPLSRRIPIATGIISTYRILIFIRLVALAFFLRWRILNPNNDAVWLWLMSVICEVWFAVSWFIDQIPKMFPINRSADLELLQEKFELSSPSNPIGSSDLPGIDFFVSTVDPEKERSITTANSILSILAVNYPVEKVACYISDDGGDLLTFETMAEAASFAELWVPFCRKHDIELRNPDAYFNLKGDPTKNKTKSDFVKDRRKVKKEYDEFKVRINGLSGSITRRSEAFNAREEMKMLKHINETGGDPLVKQKVEKATWMADGTHWPGTWGIPTKEHSKDDHAGILQVMLKPPNHYPLTGTSKDKLIDLTDVDIRLPMFVYISREKRPGYDHNKKAGAMNALMRVSAILSNGPFILNLDYNHYVYNCNAIREGMCYMMDRGGENICYIQFPHRFEGIDPSDRYSNHNNVFFDGDMRAFDGLQGPIYIGSCCMFKRFALYGFPPPNLDKIMMAKDNETQPLTTSDFDCDLDVNLLWKRFGNSTMLAESIPVSEFQGRPVVDHPDIIFGRPPGALRIPREPFDAVTIAEAVSVISCWYEDKTEWGDRVGWIYGLVTEDVVTGFRLHNRGWRSVYCLPKRDAFRGTTSINLTDRLHHVLRWATGAVQFFFSRNNALLASLKLKSFQRLAYLNIGIHPFTSFFLIVYCFLPALSLISDQFIVNELNFWFLIYLTIITICLIGTAILELKWARIGIEEWWRNEQFWLIFGISSHFFACIQGLLKVIGIEISLTVTSESSSSHDDDIYSDLYLVKWSSVMIPPMVIIMINIIALVIAIARTLLGTTHQWTMFLKGAVFAFWVLAHLYPFVKGFMGRGQKTPTIVIVWAGLVAIIISLIWMTLNPGGLGGGGGDTTTSNF